MLGRYMAILELVGREFEDIVDRTIVFVEKIRLFLIGGSWVEIRYPHVDKFSIHWQDGDDLLRLDTAPHHKHLNSFPRHVHVEREQNVVEDTISRQAGEPVDVVRNFLTEVRRIVLGKTREV